MLCPQIRYPRSSNFCLGILASGTSNGAPLITNPCTVALDQEFAFYSNQDGTFSIRAAHSGKVSAFCDRAGPRRGNERLHVGTCSLNFVGGLVDWCMWYHTGFNSRQQTEGERIL